MFQTKNMKNYEIIHFRKFYIRRNNKADSIKTRRIVIAHLLP